MKHRHLMTRALPLLALTACEFDDTADDSSGGSNYYTEPSYQPSSSQPASTPAPPAQQATNTACTHSFSRAASLPYSAAPFDLVSLGNVGFCPEDHVVVRITAGTQVRDVAAVSAAPLEFVAPLWLDERTGMPASAEVTLTVIGLEGAWQLRDTLEVDELYVDSDSPNLGEATLAMLDGSRQAVVDSRRGLTDLVGSDNILDSRLAESLAGLDLLESAILDVQYFGASSLRAPLIDGREITLDRHSLAMLDALSQAYFDGASSDGRLPKAQLGAFEDGWYEDMAHQTATGSLQMARRFTGMIGNHLGFLGLAAALTSTTPALVVVGGVAFATMIVAPAASALVIDMGTRWITGNIDGNRWAAIQPGLEYVVDAGLEFITAEAATALFPPTSEIGGAIAQVISSNLDTVGGIVEQFTDLLWDDAGAEPATTDDDGTEVDGATYDDYPDETNITPSSDQAAAEEDEEDTESSSNCPSGEVCAFSAR